MALTYSEMVPLGKTAPDFELRDFDGKMYSLADFEQAKVLVVVFMCCHCPYVIAIQERLARLAHEFSSQGVQFVGINSNDVVRYPADSPENMKRQAEAVGFDFPYLFDERQEVARAYGAVCTPDFFVFNHVRELVYRGRLDDSWKDAAQVKKQDLKQALVSLLKGKGAPLDQTPSMGCSIKWKVPAS